MKLLELGEFGLIARLAAVIASEEAAAPPAGVHPAIPASRLVLGIGDDAAVWQTGDVLTIATTDTMVADVHFLAPFDHAQDRLRQAQGERVADGLWHDLGWKALAVNLSDIAAMGGIPQYALITLGLPPETEVEPLIELYEGMSEAARVYGVRLAGGDIVRSQVLFITVALTGVASGQGYPDGVLLRSAATPGDVVAVTGWLGGSAAGLQTLLADLRLPPDVLGTLREAHLRPRPRLDEGRLLVKEGIRCAMDISDGLLADLSKLCAASRVAARIEEARVPVLPEVRRYFPETWSALALSGGEDYELLFTASAEQVARVRAQTGVPVTVIGIIETGEAGRVTLVDAAGEPVLWQGGGWDHLAEAGT